MLNWTASNAERMAENFGVVFGAAACSGGVSDARLVAAAQKMRDALAAAADDEDDAKAACLRFSAAVLAGRTAAQSGRIGGQAAATALDEIEEDLAGVELLSA
jgi:hypothetical protein